MFFRRKAWIAADIPVAIAGTATANGTGGITVAQLTL